MVKQNFLETLMDFFNKMVHLLHGVFVKIFKIKQKPISCDCDKVAEISASEVQDMFTA